MIQPRTHAIAAALTLLLALLPSELRAERWMYRPVSDADDGQLVNQTTWDHRPGFTMFGDLFLTCGRVSGTRYDLAFAYTLSDLSESQVIEDVRLRFNEQGANLTAGLELTISAALMLDPLSTPAANRFALPRTSSSVLWNVAVDWDSSGQRAAKYEESPDISPIVNELIAQSGWDASTKAAVFFVEVAAPASGTAYFRTDDTHGPWLGGGNAGIAPVRLVVCETLHDTFWGRELLCRPTPTSVQVNVVPRFATDAYCEWGADSLAMGNTTATHAIAAGAAQHFTLSSLIPSSSVFYRLRFRRQGDVEFDAGPIRSFATFPASPSSDEIRICVTTDIHVTNVTFLGLDEDLALLNDALPYMRDTPPPGGWQLWMDLGDLVVVRAMRVSFDLEEVEQRYREAREEIDLVAHSIPFILVRGNHEEVNGWDMDGSPNNTAIWSGTMLLKYFPPPVPDAYYEGNSTPFPNLGLPGNYFAFTAGSLRVRALDPYLFSTTRPHNGHGETGGSLNGWDWRLGTQQYDWLRADLVSHRTPFSVLALHHLSSCYTGTGEYYGRGGIEIAKHDISGRPSFEWGGEDSLGTEVLATQRPDFVHGAVHDLLVGEGNQVVLKGHDHFHARQSLDGMTYVTLAKPDDTGEQMGHLYGWRFFSYYPEALTLFRQNSGFFSIVANGDEARYSYVQTYPVPGRGQVVDSFTLYPPPITGAGDITPAAELRTSIDTAAPNPTRGGAQFEFQLARQGAARLALYDAGGRLVRILAEGAFDAGRHATAWDGRDTSGRRVAAGVFFARLEGADGRTSSAKMIVLR